MQFAAIVNQTGCFSFCTNIFNSRSKTLMVPGPYANAVFLFLLALAVYPNYAKREKIARIYDSKLFCKSMKEAFIGFIDSARLSCFNAVHFIYRLRITAMSNHGIQFFSPIFSFSFFFFLFHDNNPNLYIAKLKLS